MSVFRQLQIAKGNSVSKPFDALDARAGSLQLPAVMSATQLAFEVSLDGRHFHPLMDEAGEPVAPLKFKPGILLTIHPMAFRYRYTRLAGDRAETDDRCVQLILNNV